MRICGEVWEYWCKSRRREWLSKAKQFQLPGFDDQRLCIIEGGRGSGKTRGIIEDAWYEGCKIFVGDKTKIGICSRNNKRKNLLLSDFCKTFKNFISETNRKESSVYMYSGSLIRFFSSSEICNDDILSNECFHRFYIDDFSELKKPKLLYDSVLNSLKENGSKLIIGTLDASDFSGL